MKNSIKILIADDDPAIVTATQRVLQSAGYETLSAQDGQTALELTLTQRPDLLLLDINMPKMDGFEVCRRIKADPALAGTFIIILSSAADSESQTDGLNMGADGYFPRPIANRELLARVQAMLRIQAAEKALRLSEQRFRALFERHKAIILLIDPESGAIVDASPAAAEYYGYSHAEFCAMSIEAINQLPAEEVAAERLRAKREERNYFIFPHRLANGQIRTVEVYSSPIEMQGQELLFSIIHDITGRERAEEELRQSEKLLRVILTNILDPVFITDNDGKFTFICPNVANTLGYPVEKIQAMGNISKLLGSGLFNPEELESRGEITNIERTVGDSHGRQRVFLTTVKCVSIGDGTRLYALHDITERKQAEEAQRESEKRYRELFENAGLAIFQVTLDGRPIAVNPEFVRMFGYASTEDFMATVKNSAALFADPQRRAEILRLKAENPDLTTFENLYCRKDGSTFFGRMTMRAVTVPDAQVECLEGVIEDITERKRADEALYEQQQVFRTLVENSPDIIARYDRDCRRTYVNPTYLRAAQISQQKLLTTSPIQLSPLPAASAAVLQNLLRKVLDSGVGEGVDVIWPKADNIDHWYNIYASPEFDREGGVVSVMTVSRDITERKQAEEIARMASVYNRSLIEASLDPLVTIGPDGKITDVNQATETVTGVSREQLVGDDFSNYFTEPERAKEGYQKVLAEGSVRDYLLTIRHTSGKTVDVLYNASVYKNEKGEIQGVFAAARDITERKQAEEANRSHIHFLESLEQIDKDIRQETDIERMLNSVINRVLITFNCDRAWLFYPCDPDAPTFQVPVEISRPEYPGANTLSLEVPMDPSVAKDLRAALASEEPISYAMGTDKPVNTLTAQQFAVQAQMIMAIYPKIGKPWVFGMHQCSYARIWTEAEKVLFKEIGRRVADGLSTVLFFRDLRESEDHFRSIVTTMDEGVIFQNKSGEITAVNPAAERILGLSAAELSGQTSVDFAREAGIIQEDGSVFPRELQPAMITLRTGMPQSNVGMGIYKPDGALVWISINSQPLISHGESEPNAVVTTFRDITARKRAEQALLDSENRYRRITESLTDYQYSVRIENGRPVGTMQSPTCVIVTGYTVDEFAADPYLWIRMIAPEDRKLVGERVQQILAGNEIPPIEHRIFRKDGEMRWVSDTTILFKDASGNLLSYDGVIKDITERKQAEDTLKEIEHAKTELLEKLNEAQHIAEIGSWEWNLRTDQVWWSDETYRIFGVTPQDFVPSFEANGKFIHPDDFARYGKSFEHSLQTGEPLDLDLRLVAKDGLVKHCYSKGKVIYDDSGQPIRFSGTIMDITERKRAEEALRNSETRLRTLVQTIPDLIWLKDVDGVYLSCNKMFERFFGASEADIVGKTDYDFVDRELADFFREHDRKAMAAGKPTNNEELITFADDGHHAFLETIKTPMYDDRGTLTGVLGIGRDITARKQAEETLRLRESYLTAILENQPGLVWLKDLDSRFLAVNRAFAISCGKASPAELTGKTDLDIWPRELAEKYRADDARIIESKTSASVEEPIFDRGKTSWFETFKTPVLDDKGNVIGTTGFSRDITERKRAEEEIRQLNTELEQRVVERTAQLREAQEQLVRQEKLAVLGQLSGSVGHELRNPLGIINNATYYLRLVQPDADEKVREYLGIIETETHTADKIISDLLDFSRIKSVDTEPLAVPDLVMRVLERFPAPENVQVVLNLPEKLPTVYVDPRQMTQVLGNLVLNACQSMPKGGKLTLSARKKGKMVAIAIADTGVGIPPENMKKLFEPLFTTKPKGIGLGLAVSKKLIGANGGKIAVESEVGKGSVFTVYLPVSMELE